MIRSIFAAAALAASLAAPASAAATFYHSRAAWEAAVSSPTLVTDFEDQGYGLLYDPLTWGNVSIAPFAHGDSMAVRDGATYGAGNHQLNDTTVLTGSAFVVSIDGGAYAFGLDASALYDEFYLWIGDLFDNPILTFGYHEGFIGFVSDDAVSSFGLSYISGPLEVDNLTIAAPLVGGGNGDPTHVPEPAMLGLFGLGAIGLAASRRRAGKR